MIMFYGWLGESYIDEGGVMKETNEEFHLQVEGKSRDNGGWRIAVYH